MNKHFSSIIRNSYSPVKVYHNLTKQFFPKIFFKFPRHLADKKCVKQLSLLTTFRTTFNLRKTNKTTDLLTRTHTQSGAERLRRQTQPKGVMKYDFGKCTSCSKFK